MYISYCFISYFLYSLYNISTRIAGLHPTNRDKIRYFFLIKQENIVFS